MLTVDNKPTNTTVRHVCEFCVRSRINSTNSNPKIYEEQHCMANHLAIATRFLCSIYICSSMLIRNRAVDRTHYYARQYTIISGWLWRSKRWGCCCCCCCLGGQQCASMPSIRLSCVALQLVFGQPTPLLSTLLCSVCEFVNKCTCKDAMRAIWFLWQSILLFGARVMENVLFCTRCCVRVSAFFPFTRKFERELHQCIASDCAVSVLLLTIYQLCLCNVLEDEEKNNFVVRTQCRTNIHINTLLHIASLLHQTHGPMGYNCQTQKHAAPTHTQDSNTKPVHFRRRCFCCRTISCDMLCSLGRLDVFDGWNPLVWHMFAEQKRA